MCDFKYILSEFTAQNMMLKYTIIQNLALTILVSQCTLYTVHVIYQNKVENIGNLWETAY